MANESGQPLKQSMKVIRNPRPAYEVRFGRIKATVWANHNPEQGTWYSVSITRRYKDGQGQWQSATTYGRDDLPLVAKAADLAHTWIFQLHQQQPPAPNQQGLSEATDVPF
jgi:hypothetical protein